MDRDIEALAAERRQLKEELQVLNTHVRIRPASAFHPIDESSFYAEDGSREFSVSLVEDAIWGPDISHYIEEPDEFRHYHRMVVDVPNEIDGHIPAIQRLFVEWFATEE